MSGLSKDEAIIYAIIKNAGNRGTWTKDIKQKSSMHDSIVTQVMKSLEKKAIIKAVKSVKTPTKKCYMLAELEPSEELTGGSWYTDQELDVEFIDQLAGQIEKYIYSKTFHPSSQALYVNSSYPTLSQIHNRLNSSKIANMTLPLKDIEALLDRLMYDGKISSIPNHDSTGDQDAVCYKASKSVMLESTAFTDAPCGKCPVFSQCTVGGLVNPDDCPYLTEWLSK